MKSAGESIYFFYSFGFVIMRVVCVSIFGAFINEESQSGLPYLTSLPTEYYNEEVCFKNQILSHLLRICRFKD